MLRPSDDEVIAAIDRRAGELTGEAREFVAESLREEPDADADDAFRDWTIQKLAGLQVLAEMINNQIRMLGADLARHKRR